MLLYYHYIIVLSFSMEQSVNVSAIAAMSKTISEVMFYSKVRSVACQKGVIVKSRKDAKEFIRDSLLSRETGVDIIERKMASVRTSVAAREQRAPIYADIDPITSRAPGGLNHHIDMPANAASAGKNIDVEIEKVVDASFTRINARDNVNCGVNARVLVPPHKYEPVPSKEEILAAILRKVPSGMHPVRENGRVVHSDVWVRLQCSFGHEHAYYLTKVDEGLNGCHTCKCTDKYANEIRIFMEKATGFPFVISSKNCIKSDELKIYVYRVTTYQKTQVWVRNGILNCIVQSRKDCVNSLKAKLRTCKFMLPDGRYIRNLLGDTIISFDESASVFSSTVSDATPSALMPPLPEFSGVPSFSGAPMLSFDESVGDIGFASMKKTESRAKNTVIPSTSAFIMY